MTALIIIAAVIALIVLLLCLHAGVRAEITDEGGALYVKYGPLRVRIIPSKKGKKEKTGKRGAGEKKKLVSGGPGRVLDIVHIAADTLGRFKKKLVIDRLEVRVVYGGEDAAETAVAYGAASAVLGALVPLIDNAFTLKTRDFQLVPEFDKKMLEVRLRADFSIALGSLIWIALRFLFGMSGIKPKNDRPNE